MWRIAWSGPASTDTTTRAQRSASNEDTLLSQQLLDWIEERFGDDATKHSFIETTVVNRLSKYRRSARAWRLGQVTLWATITVLGMLISILAGFKSGHGFTIVAGTLVATLTTLSNASHPSKQADAFVAARRGMHREGWNLVNGRAPYTNLDAEAAYGKFADNLVALIETKQKNTSLDGLTS
jgi:hypothetical protein